MKTQVEVTIWYNFNNQEEIQRFMDFATEYPDDGFGLIKHQFKVEEGKTEYLTFTFYTRDGEGRSIKLPQEVKQRIMYPGKEWEGTPLLTIHHDGNEYEILACHIDEY